jgi:putative ABC transport system permease protein
MVLSSKLPIFEILKNAIEALRRNWGRAVLTSLSMVVGTASLVLVVVAGISGREYTLEQIAGVGTNVISVYHEAADATLRASSPADKLNAGDLNAIRTDIPGVINAAPLILSYPTLMMQGIGRVVTLIGTTPEFRQVRNIDVVRGRFLDENDERSRSKVCIVTEPFAKWLEEDPSYTGYVNLFGIRFAVIGLFRERVSSFGQTEVTDYAAIIPISVMRYFKSEDTIDQIYVSAENMDMVPQLSSRIRGLLLSRHRKQALFRVENLTEMLKAANRISLGLTMVLLAIAAVSLFSSGIGIMNVMLITVAERTREIGIKKAVGAWRRVLMIEVLVEALILSCGGGLIGILLGTAVPYSVHFFAPTVRIRIPMLAFVMGFGVTLAVGLIFGMFPAMRASRMSPVDALRYE